MDPKPWTDDQFCKNRPHLVDFVQTQVQPLVELPTCNRIIIHAPVKSGKREIMEYIAVHDTTRTHASISAWYRKADQHQREEIEQHNLTVFTITTVRSTQDCLDWIQTHLEKGQELVIHLDECDYGSGHIQSLSEVWKLVRHNDKVTCILYSATPEEVMCSSEIAECDAVEDFLSGVSVIYTPPEGYCGPERFLRENLVHEAEEFFAYNPAYVLTDQGKRILSDMRQNMTVDPRRNILILRLSYSDLGGKLDKKSNKAFYKFIQHLQFPELSKMGDTPSEEAFDVIVDKDDRTLVGDFLSERVEWSNKAYWDAKPTDRPLLIVIDQTSSRSTEWDCHDRVYATHDFRHQIRYNTVSQAQERVNHYSQKYGGFQPIRVYGSVDVFRLSAKEIDHLTFYNPLRWKLKRIGDIPKYMVVSSNGTELHPTCPPEGVDKDCARQIVRSLFKKRSLSVRIQGTSKMMPTYKGIWKKFKPENWDTDWPIFRDSPTSGLNSTDWENTHNPFTTAALHRLPNGEWRGNYRGWRKLYWKNETLSARFQSGFQPIHLTFPDKKPRKKICYKDGELGVLFLFVNGDEHKQTLHPAYSMYGIAI